MNGLKSILRILGSRIPKIFFIFLLSFIVSIGNNYAQELKSATGGTGKHKDKIQWLDFSNVNLGPGQTKSLNYSLNGISIYLTIKNVAFKATPGANTSSNAVNNTRLVA